MRKYIIGLFLLAAPLMQAGMVKVATFPVRHPVKTFHPIFHLMWKMVF